MNRSKWVLLFQSRKFWAMVFGLAMLGVSYQFGHVSLETTELSALGIISAYILGVAVEDHGRALAQASPSVTTIAIPPSVTQLTMPP